MTHLQGRFVCAYQLKDLRQGGCKGLLRYLKICTIQEVRVQAGERGDCNEAELHQIGLFLIVMPHLALVPITRMGSYYIPHIVFFPAVLGHLKLPESHLSEFHSQENEPGKDQYSQFEAS